MKITRLIFCFLLCAFFFSCGNKSESQKKIDKKIVYDSAEGLVLQDINGDFVFSYLYDYDLKLPKSLDNGIKISWQSSNEDIICSKTGKVSYPKQGEQNQIVTLTALIQKGDASHSKNFEIQVSSLFISDDSAIESTFDSLSSSILGLENGDYEYSITKNLALASSSKYGTKLTWFSSDSKTICIEDGFGVVKRPFRLEGDKSVILSAEISLRNGVKKIKEFYVTVKKLELTDEKIVNLDVSHLGLDDFSFADSENESNIKSIFHLPTTGKNGSNISWSTDNPDAFDINAGTISPKNSFTESLKVSLVATVSFGNAKPKKKVYEFLLPKISIKEAFTNFSDNLTLYYADNGAKVFFDNVIAGKKLTLPSKKGRLNLIWESEDSTVFDPNSGQVLPRNIRDGIKEVKLTVKSAVGGHSNYRKEFALRVTPLTPELEKSLFLKREYGPCYIPGADEFLASQQVVNDMANIISPYVSTNEEEASEAYILDIMKHCRKNHLEAIKAQSNRTLSQEITQSANDWFQLWFDNLSVYDQGWLNNTLIDMTAYIRREHYLKDYISWFKDYDSNNPDPQGRLNYRRIRVSFVSNGVRETGIDLAGLSKELFSKMAEDLTSNENGEKSPFSKISEDKEIFRVSTRHEFSDYTKCLQSSFVSDPTLSEEDRELAKEKECYKNIGTVLARSMLIERRFIPIELSSFTISKILGKNFDEGSYDEQFKKYISSALYDYGIKNSILENILGKDSSKYPVSTDGVNITFLRNDVDATAYDFCLQDIFCCGDDWKITGKTPIEQKEYRFKISIEQIKNLFALPNRVDTSPDGEEEDDDVHGGEKGVHERLKALAEGFHEIIPLYTLQTDKITTAQFNQVLGGIRVDNDIFQKLDISSRNRLEGSELIKTWFKEIAFEEEQKNPGFLSRLLLFWTGSKIVPSDINTNPLRIYFLEGQRDSLPRSHTCFNTIDIPVYETKEKFRVKLLQSVLMSAGTAE